MQLVQLGITYAVPGVNFRGEALSLDVVVEYTSDEARLRENGSSVMWKALSSALHKRRCGLLSPPKSCKWLRA